jgi:uncharacterized protein (TIGR03067 family)
MRVPLVLVVGFVLGFAPAPFPRTRKAEPGMDDLKKMQGTWAVVRRTVGGSSLNSKGTMTALIAGDRIKFLVDGQVRTEWVLTLDARKTPKILDRTRVGGGNRMTMRGVYLLKGDTLTICYCEGDDEAARPRHLQATGPGVWLTVFQRQKP